MLLPPILLSGRAKIYLFERAETCSTGRSSAWQGADSVFFEYDYFTPVRHRAFEARTGS